MSNLNNNFVYKLFCSKLLLQYLDDKDKREFSSSCKFIYQNCTKFRLSIYKSEFTEYTDYTSIINLQFESTEQTDDIQLDYINQIITEYKPHLLFLICVKYHNYSILEYFSIHLNSLSSLNLSTMCIPMKSFNNIIKNLPNLQVLALSSIGIGLEEKDLNSTKFEFPKYFKKLTLTYCYQFNCDSSDPVNMGRVTMNYKNGRNLDISNFTINTLKCLNWVSGYKNGIITLNELLTNNVKLKTLEVHLDRLNANSLSIISNCKNLAKLIIHSSRGIPVVNSSFPKLPFIKSLELKTVTVSGIDSVNQLFQKIPNLEEIKFHEYWRYEYGLHQNMYRFKNLKKLSIVSQNLDFLLSIPLPNSAVEHLEFTCSAPFSVSFSIFNNLKYLKRISINGLSPESMRYDYNDQLLDSNYKWREIKYSNSVQFWK
ncbi:hypothetical protein CONCODRAFT_170263 [Conidiobolus coronatus NRRL 28638]|uniref:RNI-like protein n=1 Tax=Conidiobolus coronatus (strain ATCC 28846 / CBS 209.66 / NRRL 28638) TaxID=796925 RepID=A0A137P7G9_CONC2|nr:hypothetical protein CONCODRAFT_170263 [Conidiobolus coronatus NRRL 28638]|eukprot:KXN70956.1 hypothetical protein CONCODRAFT_170263 [Conidiobolus coronatus NRRL 28638]